MEKNFKLAKIFFIAILFSLPIISRAAETDKIAEPDKSKTELKLIEATSPAATPESLATTTVASTNYADPMRYILGADDVIEITVMRHPEFSGTYPINQEGKIQYKFVADIEIAGLTKKQAEDKIKGIIANFVISPEVNITVTEYKSKVIFIMGEVGQPGKYYMHSDTISVRDAVVQAGLPTQSAAMRKSRIITPDKDGKVKTKNVDLYALLYNGNLKVNLDMRPGDILYVPCTVMAKIIRVINPVTATVNGVAAGPSGAASGKTGITSLVTK